MAGIIDTLKNSEIFADLDAGQLEKISHLCRSGSYLRGTSVFNEGDEAVELHILTDGMVALEMELRPVPNRPAIPTALEVVTKGESFGWSTLVEPYVYTLSARCMSACMVLSVSGDMLRKAIADDPRLGYKVMTKLARLISLRLMHTRLRLTSGLGMLLLGKELQVGD
jgi:CRP/FNR family cyclic AMP-dependent transcriptional regulator